MRIASAGTACRHHRIDLVKENNARRRLLGFAEHVAHASFRLSYVLRDQRRTFYGNEVDPAFGGDGLGEQGLAATGRPNQKNAFGRTDASLGEQL